MSRLILNYLLPLLLPLIFFLVWSRLARRRQGAETPALTRGPWFWLVLAGFAAMAGALTFTAVTGGGDPSATYKPPQFEGGKVVPGRID